MKKAIQYAKRGSNDALAAVAVLKAMPEIDAKHCPSSEFLRQRAG
jgi:hypothetical protein